MVALSRAHSCTAKLKPRASKRQRRTIGGRSNARAPRGMAIRYTHTISSRTAGRRVQPRHARVVLLFFQRLHEHQRFFFPFSWLRPSRAYNVCLPFFSCPPIVGTFRTTAYLLFDRLIFHSCRTFNTANLP